MDGQSEPTQLDRIEAKLDEVLAFRDLLLKLGGPWLTGKTGKYAAALLAVKGRGT